MGDVLPFKRKRRCFVCNGTKGSWWPGYYICPETHERKDGFICESCMAEHHRHMRFSTGIPPSSLEERVEMALNDIDSCGEAHVSVAVTEKDAFKEELAALAKKRGIVVFGKTVHWHVRRAREPERTM